MASALPHSVKTAGLAVVCLGLSSALWAQPAAPAAPSPARDFNTYQPTARATRIEAAEAPIIDGDLSDPVWAKAEAIDEFYQTDPDPGQPATDRTVLRFLYDRENLYVGIYAYEDP